MSIPKGYLEDVLGISLRARPRMELKESQDSFKSPIIHRQIHGDKVYVPLNRNLWKH